MQDAASCENIGPRERRKRRIGGGVALAAAIVLAAVLLTAEASRGWRWLLVLPLYGSALGFLQARARICVHLAMRGQRDLDHGPELVADALERARTRRRALAIAAQALVIAFGLTVVAVLL